jgi:hypothetical protein
MEIKSTNDESYSNTLEISDESFRILMEKVLEYACKKISENSSPEVVPPPSAVYAIHDLSLHKVSGKQNSFLVWKSTFFMFYSI